MTAKKSAASAAKEQNPNLDVWQKLEETDPNFVKPITGRSYKGTSPQPTWLIKNATRVLGPVGHGFGWSVEHEAYVEGTPHRIMVGPDAAHVVFEKMHELRIVFWWVNPATGQRGAFESYGSTRALYMSQRKIWIHDEDAAKKSLTDAITKALSQIGAAADIFMGRWDDAKYVHDLEQRYANSPDQPMIPDAPQGAGASKTLGEEAPPDEIDF